MRNNEPLLQSLLNASQEITGAFIKTTQHTILQVGHGGLNAAEQLLGNAYDISQVKNKDELKSILKKNAQEVSEKVGNAMDAGLNLARKNVNLANFILDKSQQQVDAFKNHIRKPKSNSW